MRPKVLNPRRFDHPAEWRGWNPPLNPNGLGLEPRPMGKTEAMVRDSVYFGGILDCTRDAYHGGIRGLLQQYAGELIDAGDSVRAQIALMEVHRLDALHAQEEGTDDSEGPDRRTRGGRRPWRYGDETGGAS